MNVTNIVITRCHIYWQKCINFGCECSGIYQDSPGGGAAWVISPPVFMQHRLIHGLYCKLSLNQDCLNPLECRGNYNATSDNMKLLHWPLTGGLLHLVQREEDWAEPQPAQAPPRCTKCNTPPINGWCTNHRTAV